MSRGLGKVERGILAYLGIARDCGGCPQADNCDLQEREKNWRGEVLVAELCAYVEGLADCPHRDDWLKHYGRISEARYQSVARAIRSLKKKGMVETELITASLPRYGVEVLWVSLP